MSKQLEEALRDSFCKYKYENGMDWITATKEVPVFARSVDLVELNNKTSELTAIEFKIKDWKRALNQLNSVVSCFDYLVLCVPLPKTQKCMNRIENACNEFGVGLYYWDAENSILLQACTEKKNSGIWELQKRHIINYIRGEDTKDE